MIKIVCLMLRLCTRMLRLCTRMLRLCTRMVRLCTRMVRLCTRMVRLCTRMLRLCTRMLRLCTRMLRLCTSISASLCEGWHGTVGLTPPVVSLDHIKVFCCFLEQGTLPSLQYCMVGSRNRFKCDFTIKHNLCQTSCLVK